MFERDKTFSQPIVWTTTLFMIAFHVGAVAALFFFSWKALALGMVLWWISGGLGIGMGYHRLLTHRGYKTPKLVEYFLTVCGTLALEGGPIAWVATHQVHHQNRDRAAGPRCPKNLVQRITNVPPESRATHSPLVTQFFASPSAIALF